MSRGDRIGARLVVATLVAVASNACSRGESVVLDKVVGVDGAETLFAPDHLIEIEIEIAEADWDVLRVEGRSMPHVMSGCRDEDFVYTYFPATVTVDGQRHEEVAVRKKGYLGSLSASKPSLKLNFGRYERFAGRTHAGAKRITLNNDRQDPSHTHQCMAYALFARAGIPAPRCNHAHLVVNGVDLGVYTHVEAIKKPFLARHFDRDDGNLYEAGAGADLTSGLFDLYQRKTNELDPLGQPAPRDDLAAVAQALEAPDDVLHDALDQVMEVDAFITFWAMELLAGHWDGYAGNRNNHYAYVDPTTGKLWFIPWGTDGAFDEGHSFLPSIPRTVYAWGALANRLYRIDQTRDQYRERIRQLLDEVWDEDAMLAEVDRIGELTAADAGALQEQRDFISARRGQLLIELDGVAPIWPYGFAGGRGACREPAPISGSFRTSWGDPWSMEESPATTLDVTLEGITLPFIYLGAAAGLEEGLVNINMIAAPTSGKSHAVALRMPPAALREGEVTFQGFETLGVVAREEWSGTWVNIGFIGGGRIFFDRLGTEPGDLVEGSFTGFFSGG